MQLKAIQATSNWAEGNGWPRREGGHKIIAGMSSLPKGLNTSGGANRYRFQTINDRVAGIDVDIGHKVRGVLGEGEMPDAGETGCFFKQQLDSCKEMDTSSHFVAFHREVYMKVQNMALLIHHLSKVVSALIRHLLVSSC
jgi:U3 small nucleolar RNA-associated protein 20